MGDRNEVNEIRLMIYVKTLKEYYYDVGLRKGNEQLSKTHWVYGRKVPRYLEDWIERYGANSIVIKEYGDLEYEIPYIRRLGVEMR